MAGFAAIWNTDGSPVEETLLRKMTNFLSMRGPDDQRLVISGVNKNVGLIHTAFHTTSASHLEHQPCAIDGAEAWITGELRIDARQQLWQTLRHHNAGHAGQELPSDARMALLAYKAFGSDMAGRIIGDYSFAIWDEQEGRLFAVRDHFGTRPLFYASAGNTWIVSNSVDCIRLHPKVSGDLDEIWISDFLSNRATDPERTVYKEIKRVRPGHFLDVRVAEQRTRKYWSLEIRDPIFYRRKEEYFEHFQSVGRLVVQDRLRARRVGVQMSGGLDSPSLVAFLLQIKDADVEVTLINNYYDKLTLDEESQFASAAADHFGLPLHFQNTYDLIYDPEWWTRSWVPPEPHYLVFQHTPLTEAVRTGPFKDLRVLFYGYGVDECLVYGDLRPYLQWLFKTRNFKKFGSALLSTLKARGLSIAVSRIRAALGLNETLPSAPRERPPWVRGRMKSDSVYSGVNDTWHPVALSGFNSPSAGSIFQNHDPGINGWNVESLYPFYDLRMVEFLLSVPVVPWVYRKTLIRESMQGLLPESLLKRDKTPLWNNPYLNTMIQHPFPPIFKSPELADYVDLSKIPTDWPTDVWQHRLTHRLLAFQYWLAFRQR